ncbi:MAG: ASCH domain-containing protein [Terrisporobacter sp.]|uniref:ASCH domain-containing protein n=1 Tax=Terrisporobacter sp. TaxID=1965305 RepID=UPI002FCAC653
MNAEQMWNNYIKEHSESKGSTFEAWHFGSNKELANELALLVKNGDKTSTTSGLCFYEFEKEKLPKVGSFSVILDWNKEAQCIVQITKVYIIPFNEVTEEHALKEGEGDKTLNYWRHVHKSAITEELKEYNKSFDENMKVVCEEFKVIWK